MAVNNKPRIISGQEIFDEFSHHNIHTDALLKIHPDLQVHADGKNMDYYATSINPLVDEVEITKDGGLSTYVYLHQALPFKNVQVNCRKCEGLIKVHSNPSHIPMFIEHEINFRNNYVWYSCVYEDLLKAHNFSAKTLSEIQMFILNTLQEHTKNNVKVDISNLSNSIKKLLPFV